MWWENVKFASQLNQLPATDFIGNNINTVGVVNIVDGAISITLDNSYLSSAIDFTPTINTGNNIWTIEGRCKINATPTTRSGIFFFGNPNSNANRLQLEVDPDLSLSLWGSFTENGFVKTAAGQVPLNAWFDFAVCKVKDLALIFIDGQLKAIDILNLGVQSPLTVMHIGMCRNGGLIRGLNGSIRDLIVTNNYAKYTGGYAPKAMWFRPFKAFHVSVAGLNDLKTKINFLTNEMELITVAETDSNGILSLSIPADNVRVVCNSNDAQLNSLIKDGVG